MGPTAVGQDSNGSPGALTYDVKAHQGGHGTERREFSKNPKQKGNRFKTTRSDILPKEHGPDKNCQQLGSIHR